ncbi:MAG: amidohydrolase [Elusimicrobiota bacterium]|jgi:amidohydrolase|nr:amidohydrolase [Elusimicrobiota bacterium]
MSIDKEIIRLRRHFHSNPELSGVEFETAAFIEGKLKSLGISSKRLAKTGVVGLIKGKKNSKTIALRADIDALPITEENDVSYKSKNEGIMHACGHDCHAAIMLGAAEILSKKKESLLGNVKLIFQPSEEMSGGARAVIKEGCMKNPKVDMILGVHVSNKIASGKIGIKFGAMMAGVDKIHINIAGKMSHGGYPHTGIDSICAAAEFILSVQTIVSRQINPLQPAVITIGKIAGGQNYNIVAQSVSMDATVRTLDEKVRKQIKQSIIKKLIALEISYGVKTSIDYIDNADALINSQEAAEFCERAAKDFYGEKNVVLIKDAVMGGEDFCEYLKYAPGNFMNVGTYKDKSSSCPHHNPKFNVDENALPKAAEFIAYTVEKFLSPDC